MSGGVPVELAGSPTSRDGIDADILTPFRYAPLSDASGGSIINGPAVVPDGGTSLLLLAIGLVGILSLHRDLGGRKVPDQAD